MIPADRTEEISSLEFQLTQATAAAAVPDDVAKDAAEVVAYRIHYPGGAKRLTEDGDVYEHEKRAGLKIDWLGVVGGIDAAIAKHKESRNA